VKHDVHAILKISVPTKQTQRVSIRKTIDSVLRMKWNMNTLLWMLSLNGTYTDQSAVNSWRWRFHATHTKFWCSSSAPLFLNVIQFTTYTLPCNITALNTYTATW